MRVGCGGRERREKGKVDINMNTYKLKQEGKRKVREEGRRREPGRAPEEEYNRSHILKRDQRARQPAEMTSTSFVSTGGEKGEGRLGKERKGKKRKEKKRKEKKR